VKVVFIVMARVLATFDLLPPVDETGKPRMPQAEFSPELVRYANIVSFQT
jgi:hypothetical protein